jgi:hypothetical protein
LGKGGGGIIHEEILSRCGEKRLITAG